MAKKTQLYELKSLVYSFAIQEKNAARRVATQTAAGDGKEEEEEEEKAEIRIFLFLSVCPSPVVQQSGFHPTIRKGETTRKETKKRTMSP